MPHSHLSMRTGPFREIVDEGTWKSEGAQLCVSCTLGAFTILSIIVFVGFPTPQNQPQQLHAKPLTVSSTTKAQQSMLHQTWRHSVLRHPREEVAVQATRGGDEMLPPSVRRTSTTSGEGMVEGLQSMFLPFISGSMSFGLFFLLGRFMGQRQKSTTRDNSKPLWSFADVENRDPTALSRRDALQLATLGVGVALQPSPALAASVVENAASLIGIDDNADIYYPDEFLGTWQAVSMLVGMDTPQGSEIVPNSKELDRMEGYVNVPFFYPQRFIRNANGKVVADRSFNTKAMADAYIRKQGYEPSQMPDVDYEWDPAKPDGLTVRLPGGKTVTTLVTNRVQQSPGPGRLTTVERAQQFRDSVEQGKATQTITKWLWKNDAILAGPATDDLQLIATQQVTEYLAPNSQVIELLKTLGQPVAQFSYRIALKRLEPGAVPQSGVGRRVEKV